MRSTGLTAFALAVALGLVPAIATAQPAAQSEARVHFERGLALANSQAYAEAVAELNRAYELSSDVAVLFHLGRAYAGLGQPIYAVDVLSRYLDQGGQQVPPVQRKEALAEISKQQRRIATVTIRAPLAGATVSIDSMEIGKSPLSAPFRVVAGAHVFAASLSGYKPWTAHLEIAGQEQKVLDIALDPLPAPAPTAPLTTTAPAFPPAPAPAPAPVTTSLAAPSQTPADTTSTPAASTPVQATSSRSEASSGSAKLTAYVVGGLGIGSVVVGGVFGFRAISLENDSDSQCPNDRCTQRGVDLHNQAKTSALVSDIAIGAGLVGVAVATYLFIRAPKDADATQATARIRLTPTVGPGFAGLAMGGSI